MTVYCIFRWRDVFEKSDARKSVGNLKWISCPVSFNSTGYQLLLEEFDGMTAAAMYGGWLALCQVAASAPIRGQLSGQKGEPYTPGRIARLSGLPAELFAQLIPWAAKVGWLVPLEVEADQTTENRIPDAVCESPGEFRENLPTISRQSPDENRKLPTTGQDRTGQDKTQQDRTGQDNAKRSPSRPVPVSGSSSKTETQPLSSVIADIILDSPDLQELTRSRIVPDPTESQDMATSVFAPLKASDVVSKPAMWWAAVWYKRQLASPDPILKGSNGAEAAIVVALAMSLAKVPDAQVKNTRTSMFVSLLTKGAAGLANRASPCMEQAIKLVRDSIARSAATSPQPVEVH